MQRRAGKGAVALLSALVVSGLLVSGSPAGAAPRPDLRITTTSSPATLAPGQKAVVKLTAANKGKGRAAATTVALLLSGDNRRDTSDAVVGRSKLKALVAGMQSSIRVTVAIPDEISPMDGYLLACADPGNKIKESNEKNNCKASPLSLELGPTTEELIDAAVAAGDITAEQGSIYKVFAFFGDDRLPKKFKGRDEDHLDGTPLRAVGGDWDDLSAEARATLTPFFMPPAYAGSWHNPGPQAAGLGSTLLKEDCGFLDFAHDPPPDVSSGWGALTTANFKVWYRTEADAWGNTPEASLSAAQAIAAEIEFIREKETTLFGRAPLSDADERCNGGDARFDIYVTRMRSNASAQVVMYPGRCKMVPAYMWVSPSAAPDAKQARNVAAHEYLHAIQAAYDYALPCDRYYWFEEATANWITDFVYPNDQWEHKFAQEYYHHRVHRNEFGHGRGYDHYIFFLWMARTFQASRVAQAYAFTELAGPLGATDMALDNDFEKYWHDFARSLWNTAPADDFKKWDSMGSRVTVGSSYPEGIKTEVRLGSASEKTFDFTERMFGLPPASVDHRYVKIVDDKVREVTFSGYGYKAKQPHLKIQTWLKFADGSARFEDWTHGNDVVLCRDNPAENLVEALLIYSQGDFEYNPASPFPLAKKNVGAKDTCKQPERWLGTASGVITMDGGAAGTKTHTWSAEFAVKLDARNSSPNLRYISDGGIAQWSVTGVFGDCSQAGSDGFGFAPDGEGTAELTLWPGTAEYMLNITHTRPPAPTTMTCNGNSFEFPEPIGMGGNTPAPRSYDRDDMVIEGEGSEQAGGSTHEWSWRLVPDV